jgi:flavin reductase (DIM6/NTAB) family NADH-FMN oxidoreductase RutF
MKTVNYNQYFDKATDSLPQGAFLTVKDGENLNTMTIGWATIGIIWGKPILMVLVRKSRYTYQLIENTDEFSVSFAFADKMKDELCFCGSKSGRNYDKFKECNLNAIPGQKVNTPIIGNCDLHYECKIKLKLDMDPKYLDENINISAYSQGDYHRLYFGEIIDCYLEE